MSEALTEEQARLLLPLLYNAQEVTAGQSEWPPDLLSGWPADALSGWPADAIASWPDDVGGWPL